jgi:hypothetical protein
MQFKSEVFETCFTTVLSAAVGINLVDLTAVIFTWVFVAFRSFFICREDVCRDILLNCEYGMLRIAKKLLEIKLSAGIGFYA